MEPETEINSMISVSSVGLFEKSSLHHLSVIVITFLVIEYGLEKPSVHSYLFDSKETEVCKSCVTWLR